MMLAVDYYEKIGESGPVAVNGDGHFYIVQIIPDLKPERVKLGFATNLNARLAAHRTVAPTATMAATWPCRRVWELAAMASVTRTGCESAGGEVYDCDSLNDLIARADSFFDLMP